MISEEDFDGDGKLDVLLSKNDVRVGNCCPTHYLVVSNMGKGKFVISETMGPSFDEPKIEDWNGMKTSLWHRIMN